MSPEAGRRSAVGRAPDSKVRGSGFDTRSGYILSFLLPLIQEGQLSVTGKSMVNRLGGLSLPRKSVVGLTDRPDMTLDVYRGHKTATQQQQLSPEKTQMFIICVKKKCVQQCEFWWVPDVMFSIILKDGWMTCDFISFSRIFQSYQNDSWMIMKGCVQWNLVPLHTTFHYHPNIVLKRKPFYHEAIRAIL